MSRNRDENGQFTEEVSLSDVVAVFDAVEGPVVTSGDVARATDCSDDSARRKLDRLVDRGRLGRRKPSERIIYWKRDVAEPKPVDPEDTILACPPTFPSGNGDLSHRVDEDLYGENA